MTTELDDGRMKIEMTPSYSVVELAAGSEWANFLYGKKQFGG